MNPMSAKDDLRGAYNQFVRSPIGADFLGKLVAYEMSLQSQAYSESNHEKKAQSIDKASAIYWVRTLLEDLSKPKPTPISGRQSTQSPRNKR